MKRLTAVAICVVLFEIPVFSLDETERVSETRRSVATETPAAGAYLGAGSVTGQKQVVVEFEVYRFEGDILVDPLTEGGGMERIASPRVVVLLGESFQVEITSQQPIEYFERRVDGLFEFKKSDEKTGLTLFGTVEQGKDECVILRDLTIKLSSVENRVPIEGVNLDVGRPLVRTRERVLTVAVKLGELQGVLFRTEQHGSLLVQLRVSGVQAGSASGA